jgi:hypothetical protein
MGFYFRSLVLNSYNTISAVPFYYLIVCFRSYLCCIGQPRRTTDALIYAVFLLLFLDILITRFMFQCDCGQTSFMQDIHAINRFVALSISFSYRKYKLPSWPLKLLFSGLVKVWYPSYHVQNPWAASMGRILLSRLKLGVYHNTDDIIVQRA